MRCSLISFIPPIFKICLFAITYSLSQIGVELFEYWLIQQIGQMVYKNENRNRDDSLTLTRTLYLSCFLSQQGTRGFNGWSFLRYCRENASCLFQDCFVLLEFIELEFSCSCESSRAFALPLKDRNSPLSVRMLSCSCSVEGNPTDCDNWL